MEYIKGIMTESGTNTGPYQMLYLQFKYHKQHLHWCLIFSMSKQLFVKFWTNHRMQFSLNLHSHCILESSVYINAVQKEALSYGFRVFWLTWVWTGASYGWEWCGTFLPFVGLSHTSGCLIFLALPINCH